ncbi:MAG: hypothetical protein ACEQSC_00355 [Candidatus Nanopelagicaceae bacterium]
MKTSSIKEYEEKEKAYYTSTLNMWYTIRLEKDKQLLTLSVTALGVLVTLLRTLGVSSVIQAIFFAIAVLCFFFTIILILCSLEKSSIYLKQILTDSPVDEKTLIILDRVATICFGAAMLAVLAIGADSVLNNFHQEKIVAQESQKPQVQRMVDLGNKQTQGMQGAASLRPQPPITSQNNPINAQSSSGGSGGNQGGQAGSSKSSSSN